MKSYQKTLIKLREKIITSEKIHENTKKEIFQFWELLIQKGDSISRIYKLIYQITKMAELVGTFIHATYMDKFPRDGSGFW